MSDADSSADSIRVTLESLASRDKDWGCGLPDGVPPLTVVHLESLALGLDDPDPRIRWWSTRLIACIDDDRGRSTPLLGNALRDRDHEVRHLAAMALHYDDAALPLLVSALSDQHENVRDNAGRLLAG